MIFNRAYLLAGVLIILMASHWYAYNKGGTNRENAIHAAYLKASAKAEKEARAKEQEYSRQLKKAQDDFLSRQNRLLADASAARAESSRLQHSLADFRRQLPDLTREAINRYADTASVVFDECQREYSELAATADRIDADRQMILDAWPN